MPRTGKSVARVLVVLVMVLTSTSCSSPQPNLKLLVLPTAFASDGQVLFIGSSFNLNPHGCLLWGRNVVVGQPGSSVAPDGRSVTFRLDGNRHSRPYPIGRRIKAEIGGSPFGASVPEIPSAPDVCGPSSQFILVQEAH